MASSPTKKQDPPGRPGFEITGQDVIKIAGQRTDISPLPPSVKPINPPTVPPIGTETCFQEFVWDENYRTYIWKQVCY